MGGLLHKLTFSVMIATRNRREELLRTLVKLRELDPIPDEVLICADGCTDDTAQMVSTEFSAYTLIVNDSARGSVFSRDRLLRIAKSDIVLSLDDDSYPVDLDFLSRLAHAFDSHPEAAVITFVELRGESGAPAGPVGNLSVGQYVSTYPNCAAAMRLSLYSGRTEFPVCFHHMYEEADYALQCYARGFGVWFEPALRVRHHLTAAQRSAISRHHLNARNELWSVCLRCPWPWLPLMALYRVIRQFLFAVSQGFNWVVREPKWWLMAMLGWGDVAKSRCPVPWSIYSAWLLLSRRPIQDAREFRLAFTHSK